MLRTYATRLMPQSLLPLPMPDAATMALPDILNTPRFYVTPLPTVRHVPLQYSRCHFQISLIFRQHDFRATLPDVVPLIARPLSIFSFAFDAQFAAPSFTPARSKQRRLIEASAERDAPIGVVTRSVSTTAECGVPEEILQQRKPITQHPDDARKSRYA